MNEDILEVEQYGHTFRMRDRPPGRLSACWRRGELYEQKLLDHIYSVVGREELAFGGGMAIDGGANFGNHTLFFALACGFGCVHAFEPLTTKELHDTLELNVIRVDGHPSHGVHVWPVALGAEEGWARRKQKGTLVGVDEEEAELSDVRVIRLDGFELEDVRLMKLDIEGMEPQALRGARETISRCRPIIFTECHKGQYDKQKQELAPLGYRSVGNTQSYRGATPVVEWRG